MSNPDDAFRTKAGDEIRRARIAALEDAARECEEEAARWRLSIGAETVALSCAERIRALIAKEGIKNAGS